MDIKDTSRDLCFQDPFKQADNKLLIDLFDILLEWEMEDAQKSNDAKGQKVQTSV